MAIDLIFLIMALYGFYLGYSRGIIKTVFTILSIFFGIMAAARFGPSMTDFLQSAFNTHNSLMLLAGILLTFVLTMVFIRMIASGLEGVLESANINIINQVAGGVVMAAILISIYSVLVRFADRSHIIDEQSKSTSVSYAYLEEVPEQLLRLGSAVKPIFLEFWDYSVDFMDKLKKMNVEQSEENSIFDIEEE